MLRLSFPGSNITTLSGLLMLQPCRLAIEHWLPGNKNGPEASIVPAAVTRPDYYTAKIGF
jgi:hypothetical protein